MFCSDVWCLDTNDLRQDIASLRIMILTLSDLDVDWLMTWTTIVLSMWNWSLEFANWLYHYTGQLTLENGGVLFCQELDKVQCAHFLLKLIPNPPLCSPTESWVNKVPAKARPGATTLQPNFNTPLSDWISQRHFLCL